MGFNLSPFTEASDARYGSALFGRLPLLFAGGVECFDINFGVIKAAIDPFLGFSLRLGVWGVEGVDAANDVGVSIVVAADCGVSGVNKDESENCLSLRSRE